MSASAEQALSPELEAALETLCNRTRREPGTDAALATIREALERGARVEPLSDRELREVVLSAADERAAAAGEEFIAEIRETLSEGYHGIHHNGNDHREPLSNCPRCVAIALFARAALQDGSA